MNWTEQQVAFAERKRELGIDIPKRNNRGVASKDKRTYNGRVYHSKAEAEFAMKLDLLKKHGAIDEWKPQVAYPIRWPNGPVICKLVVDFEVVDQDRHLILYEVKGHSTDIFRLKHRLFKAAYPDLDYRIVKV